MREKDISILLIYIGIKDQGLLYNFNKIYNSRPGFVRLNLPYFMDDDTISFILESVKLVAEHGWKLLPQVTKLSFQEFLRNLFFFLPNSCFG